MPARHTMAQGHLQTLKRRPRVFCRLADLRTNQWVFCGPKNADLVCGLMGKMRTYGPLKLQLFCWTSRIQQFCESTKYCTFMKWMAFCACCSICLTQARFFLLKTFLMHVVIHTIPRSMPSINTAIHNSRVGKLRTHVCQLWQLT